VRAALAAPHATCPSCGAANAAENRFCGQCATPLERRLEGERKHVTVLFADLKGSMELLTDRDPEDARRILDPILEHMMEAVHRYEGTVNQVMGDGIMALFGAPVAHEDHAVRACYAALRMQESVKRYGETVRRQDGVLPRIRVGLNSGEVVLRSIASDLHVDYTAVGETTHLAARVEQAASPGSVLVTAATLELAEGYVQAASLGPVSVKGRAAPLDVYELVGAGTARSRFQVLAARGLARFVGREAEMDRLATALERSLTARGQAVRIVGEAGVGKSRLLWQFTRAAGRERGRVLEAASTSHDTTTSYAPVVQLLRVYFRIDGRDGPRAVREKVIGHPVSRAVGEPSLSALLALLDVPVEDPHWTALEPLERRQRTLEAVTDLLLQESRVEPLILVFEDLHWIDRDSRAVLDHLVEHLADARILLLASSRPEDRLRWEERAHATEIRVDPLAPTSARELLSALLGADASLDVLKELLVERTGGNPLFVEETLRALVETRALTGEPGAYRLAEPIHAIHVPASVQAVLAARIDRLPPEEKRLLQAAAVIGHDVPVTLLQALAEAPEADVRRHLAGLRATGFLEETRLFPDLEYGFRHPLAQEVAYAALLQQRRRELHARLVDAIESLPADRRAEHVERLAYHASRAERWDQAVTYLRDAAMRAATRSAYGESLASFEDALRALGRLPETPATSARAIDLRLDSRVVLAPLGQYDRILRHMQEAEVLARGLGDRHRLGLVLADMGARLRNVGEHRSALEASRQALEIAAELEDRDLEHEARYRLAQAQFALGSLDEATTLFLDLVHALAAEAGALPRFFHAWPHAWLGVLLSHLGRFEPALAHADEAIRIALRTGHPHTLLESHAALGGVSLERGDLATARGVFERGLALVRGGRARDPNLVSGLGYVLALSGEIPEALPLLEEAVGGGASISAMASGLAVRMSRLADAYRWAGRGDEARRVARDAVELSTRHRERANEAIALRALADVAAADPAADASAAEQHYADSLALAHELGMRPLGAHGHRGLGALHRRRGRRREAQAHLATALQAYRELDMRWWPEQVEAEMRAL
jgi:class 3 adenylate cyclase/tetratricopeptide (TPR) repeat protein